MAPNGRWLLLRPPLAACSQVCTAGRRPRFKARITSSQITSTTTAVIRRSILVTLSRPLIDELDNDQARPVVIGYPPADTARRAAGPVPAREAGRKGSATAHSRRERQRLCVPTGAARPVGEPARGDLNSLVASRCYSSRCMLPFYGYHHTHHHHRRHHPDPWRRWLLVSRAPLTGAVGRLPSVRGRSAGLPASPAPARQIQRRTRPR
jgi:hypothetical protein